MGIKRFPVDCTIEERYLMKMTESLKDINKTLGHINDCLGRINDNLRNRVPMPKEENVKNGAATCDEGVSEM